MRTLTLPMKVALGVYLFIVGVLAVNIHIQMLQAGIPHPSGQWNEPTWYSLLRYLVQLIGMLWLHQWLKERFPSFGYWQNILLLFAIMVTLSELVVRLPMTAGYVNGPAFLFTWAVEYLPKTIILFISAVTVVLLATVNRENPMRRAILAVGITVAAILVWKVIEPLAGQVAGVGVQLFRPPNPEDIIPFPYGRTVNLIASVFFIEPVTSCFVIGWLIWDRLSTNISIRILQFMLLVLMLVNRLVDQTVFMLYSTLPPKRAFLSMGQFTFEWVFLGLMIPVAIIFINRTNEISRNPAK